MAGENQGQLDTIGLEYFEKVEAQFETIIKASLDDLVNENHSTPIDYANKLSLKIDEIDERLNKLMDHLYIVSAEEENDSRPKNNLQKLIEPFQQEVMELQKSTNLLVRLASKSFPKEKLDENSKVSIQKFLYKEESAELGF